MKLNRDLLARVMAEFFGSVIVVSIGCLGTINVFQMPSSNLSRGFNFGLAVLASSQCFLCVSGGHINPCVTIAAMIVERVEWDMGLVYIVCQFLGAIVGYGIYSGLEPDVYFIKGTCVTMPIDSLSVGNAVAIEFVLTATWVLAMCAIWDSRNQISKDSAPLRIGLTVSSLTISGGYLTGASMNPARSLAPAVWNGQYEKLWIYFAGPLLAAILMGVAWRFLYSGGGEGKVEESE